MADDVEIRVRVRDQTGPGFAGVNRNLDQMEANADRAAGAFGSGGSGGGGLMGALYGVAGVLGTALLPSIGALVPMMAGAGIAGGTLAMGFHGIGAAAALAGSDTKKYHEALKKMPPEAQTFTKALVGVKGEFSGLREEIQANMLPGFTQALRDAGPVIDIVQGSMFDMSKAFGDAARGLGRLMKDAGFQDDFAKTLKLGSGFVRDITASLGPFTKSLFHFGAVSEESLGAFSDGISGLLSKGIPGFFTGLEKGISGSAKMVGGLFDALNSLLPALGRFSGSFSDTFGPLLGSMLRYIGDLGSAILDGLTPALDALTPVTDGAAHGFDQLSKFTVPLAKGLGEVLGGAIKLVAPIFSNFLESASIALPIIKDLAVAIGGPLIDAFLSMTGAGKGMDRLNGGLEDLANWAKNHRAEIDRAFRSIAVAILDVVIAVVDNMPSVFRAFQVTVNGVLDVLGFMVTAAAVSFGWIPGIGDKLKKASGDFNVFRGSVGQDMDKAGAKIQEFHDRALPKLRDNKLKLDVSPYNAALGSAGRALRATKLNKHAKLTASWAGGAAVRRARSAIGSVKGKSVVVAVNYVESGTVSGKLSRATGGVIGAMAHGGITTAASGGARGSMTWVGEQGPELVRLPYGSTVYPAGQSRQMAMSGGGGGGHPIQVNLVLNGRVLARELFDSLRGEIRDRGGLSSLGG